MLPVGPDLGVHWSNGANRQQKRIRERASFPRAHVSSATDWQKSSRRHSGGFPCCKFDCGRGSPSQEQRPTFKADATFVRVDVYPTRDGRPVDDLRMSDFEVFEDGAPQMIASFEHVVVHSPTPGSAPAEPNTVSESSQRTADPRSRVFVLFLDLPHVSLEASRQSAEPLIRLLDRLLGPDDLIGVMTPGMHAADVTLARKTEVLESLLRDRVPWGERERSTARERAYEQCYAQAAPERVAEMAARGNERATLEALRGLVDHLGQIREERKSILIVSEGWQLYRPTNELTTLTVVDPSTGETEAIPGRDPISIGPGGKITTKDSNSANPTDRADCERDRLRLSSIDDERYFKDLIDAANRANASFYTIDPRGVPVFDTSLAARSPGGRGQPTSGGPLTNIPGTPTSAAIDALEHRQDVLRTLATDTDGIAVMNNDLDRGLKRIADDGTSYYLVGYYSTNLKLDGTFRALKVRVNRPGVDVRARRGYRAATAEEVAAAGGRASSAKPVSPVAAALSALGAARWNAKVYVAATPGPKESGAVGSLWVAAELQSTAFTLTPPASADVEVTSEGNSATIQVPISPDARSFVTAVKLSAPIKSGVVQVQVHLTGAPDTERESIRVDVGSDADRPLLFRRGPTTANRLQPAASAHFNHTERLRLEIPAETGDTIGSARLLDKKGQPLAIPLTTGERTDDRTGQRWLTADLTLAPLAMGDYPIEVTVVSPAGERKVVTAFRLVP